MGTTSNIVVGGATALAGSAIGFIKDGVVVAPLFETYRVGELEGLPASVKARRTGTEYSVSFTIVEPTQENLRIGHSNYASVWDSSPPTPPTPRILHIEAAADIQEVTLSVTGIVPGGAEKTRTLIFTRAFVETPQEMKFTDFEETKIPTKFVCLYDSSGARVGFYLDAT